MPQYYFITFLCIAKSLGFLGDFRSLGIVTLCYISGALSPSTVTTTISTKASDYVKVAYMYTPEQSDELELEVKDFIRVLSRDLPEEGWWRGTILRTN